MDSSEAGDRPSSGGTADEQRYILPSKNSMRPREHLHNPGIGQINAALNRVDDIADRLLRSNETCLICMRDGPMRNGHIVGEKFLELIASKEPLKEFKIKKDQIYCWPTSARSITRLALPALKEFLSQRKRGPIEIECYSPVPRSKNHKDCKFTFAYCTCEDHALELTDSVCGFDPQDGETVFELGLRTFAAYTAWYDGHKRWAKEDLGRNSQALLLIKQYPHLQSAFEALSDWGARKTAVGKQLESEMQRWRHAYQNSSWGHAIGSVIEAPIRPRIAGCGIANWSGSLVAITILPNKDGKSFIIATTLLGGAASPSLPNAQRTVCQELAKEWGQRFENQSPEQWLPEISRLCEFLYVSPEDYHDDSVVSETARQAVATAIAAKISAIPDLRTGDPSQILLERDPL